ncbi:hypothetical protein ACFXKF_36230 [Streptomyces scopuliridis]|uniref:hypothetical protein n=1 Tax=Streptomyces scopuliridis TaxID=452529 RepID=UPI00368E8AA7
MLQTERFNAFAESTESELRVAAGVSAVVQTLVRLMKTVEWGAWFEARNEARYLREDLEGLIRILPAQPHELGAYDCRPAQIDVLLEAAGFPMVTLQNLQDVDDRADFAAFADSVRDTARRELAAFGDTVRGRDTLLHSSARVGISEVESAHLTGLSRNTVRKALGKVAPRRLLTITPAGEEAPAGDMAPGDAATAGGEAPLPVPRGSVDASTGLSP